MKLLFFDDFRLGVLKGDTVVDISETVRDIPHDGPHDLINGLIAEFARRRGAIEDVVERSTGIPLSQVRISPPLPKPFIRSRMATWSRSRPKAWGACASTCATT